MVMRSLGRSHAGATQSGQAIVLAAFMLAAMLGMLALVLDTGGLYWERRSLQGYADAAALAGSMQLGPSCDNTVASRAINEAVRVLGLHLGAGSGPTISGDCGSSAGYWTGTSNFPNSVSVTIRYPYQTDATRIEVVLSEVTPLGFVALLGTSTTTVSSRAVAKWLGGTPGHSFAAYSKTTIQCLGNSDWTVFGTVYARQSLTGSAGCGIQIHSITNVGQTYQDFGNLMVLASGENWNQPKPLKVDGWAQSGLSCAGSPYMYNDPALAAPAGPDPSPCSLIPVQAVPDIPLPTFVDPNANLGNLYTPTQVAGCDPPPSSVGTTLHYSPGCYSKIDVANPPLPSTNPPFSNVVLDPGFYYFNGQGLCLGDKNATISGTDVTLMFVNSATFTTGTCAAPTTVASQCKSFCKIGTAANYFSPPPAPGTPSAWCNSSCTSRGLLVYSTSTGPLYLDSPNGNGWLNGTISWGNGPCTFWSNGGGILQGQLLCNSIVIDSSGQGGAANNALTFIGNFINNGIGEASLTE